jgi:hypothetical protein
MRYAVYQIDAHINRQDAVDAMMGVGTFKANDAFKAGKYTHVANVEAEDMERVFAIMNVWPDWAESHIERLAPLHSLSVGDVLHDGAKAHVVATFGFKELAL